MTRILRSIAIRFPVLLGVIVLVVALVTGQMAQRQIGEILMRQASEDLSDGATQVAAMLGGTVPAARRTLTETGATPAIRRALAATSDAATAQRLLEETLRERPLQTRLAARLLSAEGVVRAAWAGQPGATAMGWTVGAIREGSLRADSTVIGPIVSIADTMPGFVILTPVRDADGRMLGWLEEVHAGRGTGAADIRALIDVERLLIGSRGWTVWSDFTGIVPGPTLTEPLDSLQRLVSADGSVAMGLGRPVPGTPWVVWVERPEGAVLAPIESFLRRMWMAVLAIALVGAAAAWMLGHMMAARIRVVASEMDRTLSAHGGTGPAPRDAEDELRHLEESYAALEARVEQRRQLDEQLLQAQKLEAVGRLAGGIAHDFNNLLTVMSSYGVMVKETLPPNSPASADMDEVLKATERATALTRQLLAFSRQRIGDARPLDVNEVVGSTDRMLARLIPSNVERVVDLGADLPLVRADRNQLEQVLINLVVNAVDAMPEGGRVGIRTTREMTSRLAMGVSGDDAPRDCVCLTVSDTGMGMDAATLARIFDPFFTTKAVGKGTGLGLATVHGIVRDAGGAVVAYSEPGQGTAMRVYLPVAQVTAEHAARVHLPIAGQPLPPGRIVVAEDDPATRLVITRILQKAGHTVHAFATADAAMAWLEAQPPAEPPTAIVTDVMMPGMNGIAFVGAVRQRYPDMPVVVVSGYADVRDRIPDAMRNRPVTLEKPFTASALHDALRRAALQDSGREA